MRRMQAHAPPTSEAHATVSACLEFLQTLRDDAARKHGIRLQSIPLGAFDVLVWRGMKTLRADAHLPDHAAAVRHWQAHILARVAKLEKDGQADRIASLTWPPHACSVARVSWIAGEIGRAAVDALAEVEAAERRSQLPPGSVAARLMSGAPRETPGKSPEGLRATPWDTLDEIFSGGAS